MTGSRVRRGPEVLGPRGITEHVDLHPVHREGDHHQDHNQEHKHGEKEEEKKEKEKEKEKEKNTSRTHQGLRQKEIFGSSEEWSGVEWRVDGSNGHRYSSQFVSFFLGSLSFFFFFSSFLLLFLFGVVKE